MKSDARLTGFVDVDGARLHFEVAGQGHPLVLMHAGIADSRMWDDQIDAFARHFMTIRYDRRGHGRTVSTPGQVLRRMQRRSDRCCA